MVFAVGFKLNKMRGNMGKKGVKREFKGGFRGVISGWREKLGNE